MLDTLKASDFEPHRGTMFRILPGGGLEVPIELAQVQRLTPESAGPTRGEAFSLMFHAALSAPALPQRIYRVEHAAMAPLEIFLVPLGPERGAFRYEAIFT